MDTQAVEALLSATDRQKMTQEALRAASTADADAQKQVQAARAKLVNQLAVGIYIYKGRVINVSGGQQIIVTEAVDLEHYQLSGEATR